MSSKSDEFNEVARKASAGDSSALAALCREYESEVRIAARVHLGPLLRPHVDSIDITQSVHKSVIGKLLAGKIVIDDSAKLVALACLIARRKVAKSWRKHRKQVRRDFEADTDSVSLAQVIAAKDASDREDKRAQVRSLAEDLNASERRLIQLKLAAFTSEEIADFLKIDPIAVRVRWSRLCAKMRKQAGSQTGGEHLLSD